MFRRDATASGAGLAAAYGACPSRILSLFPSP
ncbi:hypothetical protein NK6_5936 [Bradyrhizobium diazoefficiens]|uniref:Uncharacterized protein n=1 Tax=Bradyrhizobium diazoefficiens TaxID=1355477 RepID=A0A0E4FV41_9BRAD|nr:hypothetical protein NK6_5936 [Bradyrhizobium diazoefficiens]